MARSSLQSPMLKHWRLGEIKLSGGALTGNARIGGVGPVILRSAMNSATAVFCFSDKSAATSRIGPSIMAESKVLGETFSST